MVPKKITQGIIKLSHVFTVFKTFLQHFFRLNNSNQISSDASFSLLAGLPCFAACNDCVLVVQKTGLCHLKRKFEENFQHL